MSSVDHLTAKPAYDRSPFMLDLEDQTPVIAGKNPGRRVLVKVITDKGALRDFAPDPSLQDDIWATVKHEPLSTKGFHRRDHDFAVRGAAKPVYFAGPTIIDEAFGSHSTPIGRIKDYDFALFDRTAELTHDAFTGHWNVIVVLSSGVESCDMEADPVRGVLDATVHPATDVLMPIFGERLIPTEPLQAFGRVRLARADVPAVPASAEAAPAPVPSEAWSAFEALAGWLGRTDEEIAELLGIGRTTAYAWRRSGHEPQARTARRLYEAHALVRQLVAMLGQDDAQTLLARGGNGSAIALIGAGRVSDAEALFADVIYQRPAANAVPLNAVTGLDVLTPTPLRSGAAREPAVRRRVEVRRRS